MPNGFHGRAEEWERLVAPFREIDGVLESFSEARDLTIHRNERNSPGRSLRWGDRDQRLIQIVLADERSSSYDVWVCVIADDEGGRRWRQQYLKRGAAWSEIKDDVGRLLDEGYRLAQSWENTDLVPLDRE